MSKNKLKIITHKDRKEYVKKLLEVSQKAQEDPMASMEELTKFREEFLVNHLMEPVELDKLPSEEVDELLKEMEDKMDFHMGLKRLMSAASLNIAPSKEAP